MFRRTMLAATAALTLACSSPPNQERHQADGAIAAAHAADAATYAPEQLKAAEAAIAQYDAAVAERDYRAALRLALDARDNAYAAVKRAGDEKAAARSEAERLIAELDTLARAGHARIAGPASARTPGLTLDDLKMLVAAADKTLQEARAFLEKQDYRSAMSIAAPAAASLRDKVGSPAPRARR
jgi:hypothetical protein